MNKGAIKRFAVEARRKLIASVKDRAGLIGITNENITEAISKGEGYAVFPTHIGIETTLVGKELKQRDNLVNRIQEKSYKSVIEEVAYTWFNRMIAVRFMEVNDYLPSRIRVLSSETKGKFEPDIVTQAPKIDLQLTDQEIEEIISLKEKNELDKLFRLLFVKQCNELGEILPELFENTSQFNKDYTEILLDVSYTNEDGVIRDLLKIDEEDFLEAVEIIGWMYQYYNTEPKDETFALLKQNIKITKERIPAVTQLFTPDWIVRYMVENSLGRLWQEGHPDSSIKANWIYSLEEAVQEPNVKEQLEKLREDRKNIRPEDIKVIDPCMGSGHILVYAFDVLMDIYRSCGYEDREATKLILKNNLYGLDIDDRAYQFAYFAVMMKARGYSRRILNEGIKPNLCAIQESPNLDSINIKELTTYFVQGLTENEKFKLKYDFEYLIEVFHDAKEYGSILDVNEIDFEAITRRIEEINAKGSLDLFTIKYRDFILEKLIFLINQAKVMGQKYDVVITNPPYMGTKNMGKKLSNYVIKNYPYSKYDLFAVFIEKCSKLTKLDGFQAIITQHSFMFLSSYEKLRKILYNKNFVNMIHLGSRAFEEIGGEVVQTTAFVLSQRNIKSYKSTYLRLVGFDDAQVKQQKTIDAIHNNVSYKYCVNTQKFNNISGFPVAYWVSDKVGDIFKYGIELASISEPRQGLATADNDKFIRLWYEVCGTKIGFGFKSRELAQNTEYKYFPYNKGGEIRKWYGNNIYVIDWYKDGQNIKADKLYKLSIGKCLESNSRPKNMQYYYKKGITWSLISSTNFGVRCFPQGMLFDVGSHSVFCDDTVYNYIAAMLNTKIAKKFLGILNPTMNFSSGIIAKIPIIFSEQHKLQIDQLVEQNVSISKMEWDSYETSWDYIKHPLLTHKHEILEKSFDNWRVFAKSNFAQLKANEEDLNQIFIEIYGLQEELTPDVAEKDVTIRQADLARDIKSFISYAVGCMFGRYSLDVEGLANAGSELDGSKYKTFIPDADNIIHVTDEEYFGDDIVSGLVRFVKEVYGEDTLEENLDFMANALGTRGSTAREVIRNYFLKDFYKDHVKIYQKRPIYWLFESGKENGFKALIYLHRYNEDTVGRVRADYLHKTQAAIENAITNCDVVLESNASASDKAKAVKQKGKLVKQLAETRIYDQAIAHIAHQRIPLDLDDGVTVNYAKFQGIEVSSEGKKSVKVDLLGKI